MLQPNPPFSTTPQSTPLTRRQKLHGLLQQRGDFTGDYESFESAFSNPDARKNLYAGLIEDKVYTKSPEEFTQQFFVDLDENPNTGKGNVSKGVDGGASGTGAAAPGNTGSPSKLPEWANNIPNVSPQSIINTVEVKPTPEEKAAMQPFDKDVYLMQERSFQTPDAPYESIQPEYTAQPKVEKERNPLVTAKKSISNYFGNVLPTNLKAGMAALTSAYQSATKDMGYITPTISGDFPVESPKTKEEIEQADKDYIALKQDLFKQVEESQKKTKDLNLIESYKDADDILDWINLATNYGATGAGQLVTTLGTAGASSFGESIGADYLQQVQEIADKNKISPQQVIEKGMDKPAMSVAFGSVVGAVDALTGKTIGKSLAAPVANSIRKRALGVLTDIAKESGTEVIQGSLTDISTGIAAEKDASEIALNAINPERRINDALGGAFAAGALRGAGSGIKATANTLRSSSNSTPQVEVPNQPESPVNTQPATETGIPTGWRTENNPVAQTINNSKLADDQKAQVFQAIENIANSTLEERAQLSQELGIDFDNTAPEEITQKIIDSIAPNQQAATANQVSDFDALEAELEGVEGKFDSENTTITNPVKAVPENIVSVLDKMETDAYLTEDEMLATDSWVREAKRKLLSNPNIPVEEKKGTLDALNNMLGLIDKANERFVQAASVMEGDVTPQNRDEALGQINEEFFPEENVPVEEPVAQTPFYEDVNNIPSVVEKSINGIELTPEETQLINNFTPEVEKYLQDKLQQEQAAVQPEQVSPATSEVVSEMEATESEPDTFSNNTPAELSDYAIVKDDSVSEVSNEQTEFNPVSEAKTEIVSAKGKDFKVTPLADGFLVVNTETGQILPEFAAAYQTAVAEYQNLPSEVLNSTQVEALPGSDLAFTYYDGVKRTGKVSLKNPDGSVTLEAANGRVYRVTPDMIVNSEVRESTAPGEQFSTLSKIQSSKDKVNPNDLQTDGVINEPSENSPEQFHPGVDKPGRIKPSPLIRPSETPIPKLGEMLAELANGLKTKLNRSRKMKGLGSYNPTNAVVKIKTPNDLDVAAHELGGHFLSDAFGMLKLINKKPYHTLDDELKKFWVYGSTPPSDVSEQVALDYMREEGVAEFIRALIVNPEAAKSAAPKLTELYESKVPVGIKSDIDNFSNGYRQYVGDTATNKVLANVETLEDLDRNNGELKEQVPFYQKLLTKQFYTDTKDEIAKEFLDSQAIWRNAFIKATQIKGITDLAGILPEANPLILADNFMGITRRFNAIFKYGLVNNRNEIVRDNITGEAMPFEWLYAPIAGKNEADLKQNEKLVLAFMVAKRTLEYRRNLLRSKIEQALNEGKIIRENSILDDPKFSDLKARNNELKAGYQKQIAEKEGNATRQIAEVKMKATDKRNRINEINLKAVEELFTKGSDRLAEIEWQKISNILKIDESTVTGRIKPTKRAAVNAIAEVKGDYERKLLIARLELAREQKALKLKNITDKEVLKIKAINTEAERLITQIYRKQRFAKIDLNSVRNAPLTGIGGGIFDDADIAEEVLNTDFDEMKWSKPALYDNIVEASRRYKAYSNQLLKYAVEAGRMSQKEYDQILANNEDYVSLQRLHEEYAGEGDDTGQSTFASNKSVGSPKQVIKKVKGGADFISNPYLNLNLLTYRIVREADRNKIMVALTDMFSSDRRMQDGKPMDLSEFGYKVNSPEENTITVFRNGEKEYFKFSQEVCESLKQIGDAGSQLNIVGKVLEAKASIIRSFIVKFPTFQLKNIIRDTITRPNISNVNSGFKDLFTDKETWHNLELYGGSQEFDKVNTRVDFFALQRRVIRELSKKGDIVLNPLKIASSSWDWYTDIMGKGENVNRAAEYKAAYRHATEKLGYDSYNANLYAAAEARNLLNFAKAGTFMRTFNRFVPFSNARLRAVLRTYEAFAKNPKQASKNVMLYTVLPSMLIYAFNRATLDESELEELDQQPWYIKHLFWNFKLTDNTWLRIPRPATTSVIAVAMESLLTAGIDEKPLSEAFEGFGESSYSQLLPMDIQSGLNGIPPELQIGLNNNIFQDAPIVSEHEKDMDLKLRKGDKYASDLAQSLREAMGVVDEDMEVDPRYIDFYLKSQFGYVGSTAVRLSNIGNEGKAQNDWLLSLGIFAQSPAVNSSAARWVEDAGTMYDLYNNSDTKSDYQEYLELKKEYYEAKTDKERSEAAKALREYATWFRKEWEGQTIYKEDDDAPNGEVEAVIK